MIYTIGHSTRLIKSLLEILNEFEIVQVVDVRTIPYSEYSPQFNKEALAKSLKSARIVYVHMKEPGGLRHPIKDSVNLGWKNASFRGYADYMQTADFAEAIEKLIEICEDENYAIMCAEAVPGRCHRSLIADALFVRGINVMHILSKTSSREHELTSFARIRGKIINHPK
jgi:uncharacterized protein (DUF488 family)